MITPCTVSDLPALAAMLHGLHAAQLHVLPQPTGGAVDDLGKSLHLAMIRGTRILAYRTEDVPRGILLWHVADRPSAPRAPRQAVLDHIYVAPGWRRRGIKRRLVRRFEAELAAAGCVGWLTATEVAARQDSMAGPLAAPTWNTGISSRA
ncbi:GNAT family N-acetyltransferase [Marinovum sp. 2_MG-2023]|uniref:GNAT family N-acetyltransferase n=1 Tax=unclassified Marinovum TaxID=2647166 RepID=UPI0026E319F4|nr:MULTISPECIES: GNAT family N-acetyltransferase [unclassified Marinovum]MDO6732440.1 GNAT family N-acetyltransferase [Marinovum sp. 2_MG-2023]MDO6781727.1 GNAT family N-acetyltransferase [Marinovum sp. 1_MG-2023]